MIILLNILIIILEVMILSGQANIKRLLRKNKELLDDILAYQVGEMVNEAMKKADIVEDIWDQPYGEEVDNE
ncbi:MAG: hypothetical protein IKU98_03470 [Bacteroidaceae bacterium]|nr:hypothetical protein [Bacteroidaceae bacterium]